MKFITKIWSILCGTMVSKRRAAYHHRVLAVEHLGPRELLAADVAMAACEAAPTASELGPEAPVSADDAMIGAVEDLRGIIANGVGGNGVGGNLARGVGAGSLDGPIGPVVSQPNLDTPAAMNSGYGGYGPTLTIWDVEYVNGVYEIEGVFDDDDATGATITIIGQTVDITVVLADGSFDAEVTGTYLPVVVITATDQDGNTDTRAAVVN